MNKKLLIAGCGATALAVAIGTTAAFATPGSNPAPAPVAAPVLGDLDGPTKAKNDKIEIKVGQDTTVRSFTLKYPKGSFSGWHSHPGLVVAVVEEGTVVRQNPDCTEDTFKVGDAFIEEVGHNVINPSATTDASLRITQFFPADTDPKDLRVDIERKPNCS